MSETDLSRPPRDNLFRAAFPGVQLLRATDPDDGDDGGDEQPTMVGHFARINEWTEIDSFWEGRFLERFAAGAFKKTIRDNRDRMRVLFQHGYDPQIGDKPLGPIADLREDDQGAYYEVPLLDATYVRQEILPGLEAGLYGASFRFSVLREEWNEEPGASEHNPDGIPERTVKEARVSEFGPVTFPAYENASAGIRSLTDEFILERLERTNPERFRELMSTRDLHPAVARAATARTDTTAAAPSATAGTGPDAGRSAAAQTPARRQRKTPLAGSKSNSSKEKSWRL